MSLAVLEPEMDMESRQPEPFDSPETEAINSQADNQSHEIVQFCKMLSDPTRLRIMQYLAENNELHVTALCDLLHQSQPAVSHHLALLRSSGLIAPRRDGKHNFYSARKEHIGGVLATLAAAIGEEKTSDESEPMKFFG